MAGELKVIVLELYHFTFLEMIHNLSNMHRTYIYTNNRVCTQKKLRDANKLDSTRVTLLNSIGFDFIMNKPHTWEENFAELKDYLEKNGSNAEYGSSGRQSNKRMYKW